MAPPKNFEGLLQHDDVHEVQGLPQDQPCLSLTKLLVQPHTYVCGQAAIVHCPAHGGSCPSSWLVW